MSRREKLEGLLAKSPEDPFLHFGLAMEYVKEGRFDDACARFDQAVALDPAYTAAYHHKGFALIAAGRQAEAREILQRGIAAARKCGNDHALSEMQELLNSIV